MANQKISQMPSLTASELAAGDLLAVVDVSDVTQASSGSNKKITLTDLQSAAISAGTANGVLYLNGSKVATSGSALTFDGSKFEVVSSATAAAVTRLKGGNVTNGGAAFYVQKSTDSSTVFAVGDSSAITGGSPDVEATIYTGTNIPLRFYVNAAERARIDSAGNLGIGTSSPAYKLDVRGGILAAGNGTIVGGISYSTRPEIGAISNHPVGFITNNVTQMLLDTAGNLGLGVTPSAWGTGYKAINIATGGAIYANTNSSAAISIGTNVKGANVFDLQYKITGQGATQYNQYNGVHSWYTAPSGTAGNPISFTQAMTLDASGNLLVGTTSSSSIAAGGVVLGNLSNAIGGAVSGGILTMSGVTTTSYVGLFSNPNGAVGSITVAGATTAYNTSSDYRLKTIAGPVTNSGAYIDSLNPVEGTWKADGSTFVGLIAHEVQEVSRTQVATGEKDGAEMQAMDYSNSELIANLIAEVKSLRARVAALESN